MLTCIPLIRRYSSTDPIMLERVYGTIPGVGLYILVNGLVRAEEGESLLSFLSRGFLDLSRLEYHFHSLYFRSNNAQPAQARC